MPVTVFPPYASPSGVLTPWSLESVGTDWIASSGGVPASAVNTAQLAIYVPFGITAPYVIRKVGWLNGTVVGNGAAEVGCYTESGTLIISGSATTAGASVTQTVDVTDTTLDPGRYYMAYLAQNGTDTVYRSAPAAGLLQAMGIMQQASQGSLPSTATYAVMATAFLPMMALLQHTII